MTFVAMTVVDKAGRRVLLIISAVVMSLSFFGLGLYLDQSHKVYKDSILSWLPLILIALYISAFSLGFGPIPWVVMGEIFSNEVRLVFE
jgi:MFS family permease